MVKIFFLIILFLLTGLNLKSEVLNDRELQTSIGQMKLKVEDSEKIFAAAKIMNRVSKNNFFIAYGMGWDALFYGKNSCRIDIFENVNGQTKKVTYELKSSNFTLGLSVGVGALLVLGTINGNMNLNALENKEFKSAGVALPLNELIQTGWKSFFKAPLISTSSYLFIPDHFEVSIGIQKDDPSKMVYTVLEVGPHGTAGLRFSKLKFGKKLVGKEEEDSKIDVDEEMEKTN